MDKYARWVVVACIAILVIGSFATYEAAVQKDATMRADLLAKAKLATTAVNASDIKALTGTPADLDSSQYQKLKLLMAEQRDAEPASRFVYLLGQYPNGTIFFYIDSEPASMPDNSPPGEIYDVHSTSIDDAFGGIANTGGPLSDQWGVWVSGLVPIIDPETGKVIAVLGIDISATDWNNQIIDAALVPGLTSLLIATLIVIFFTMQGWRKEENRKLAEWAEALRESSEKYRTLIENSQDTIFIVQDTKMVFVSPAIKDILGHDSEMLIGTSYLDLVAPQDRERFRDFVSSLQGMKGVSELGRVRLLHREVPREAVADLSISAIDYHGEPAFMGTLHDQTAKENAEAALVEANRKLQLMTGITRHDIMNQLLLLRGNLELVKMAQNPSSAQESEAKAMQAVSNIEAMIAFTKDYQDIGMNAPTWQVLSEIVRSSAIGLNNPALEVMQRLPKMEILADPLIVKVFHNLIDNAIRHGSGTKKIEFTAQVVDDSLAIFVQDDGAGIDERDKARIFERGYGKHTGMGLFFSREVLSITGITIGEDGKPGQGARFVINVPTGKWRPLA